LSNFFLTSLWPGLLVWILLYISDYTLTITCARLYRNGVNEKLVFEGSYEITPYFQKDIDALRLISPRFLLILVLFSGLLAVERLFSQQTLPHFYEFLLGALILAQLQVHTRHLRNLFLFRAINKTGGVSGRIEYSRPLLLRMSAVDALVFSGLYLVLFAFTQSWFIFGGVVVCLSLAVKHRRLARKWSAAATATAPSPDIAKEVVQAGSAS
jgi:hypothetical protein